MHIPQLMSYYIDLFPCSRSRRLCASPGARLCFFHLCILSPSNIIESLCVSMVTKDEVGRHMGWRPDDGGVSVREGKCENWRGPDWLMLVLSGVGWRGWKAENLQVHCRRDEEALKAAWFPWGSQSGND